MIDEKFDPSNLFLKGFKCNKWYEIYKKESKSHPEESIAEKVKLKRQKEDLSGIPPLEGYEEMKEEKVLKMLTTNKLLTRLPILLA